MKNSESEEYIPEPCPAVVIRYENNNWDGALADFYRKNPHLQHKISVILLPKGGFNPFKRRAILRK